MKKASSKKNRFLSSKAQELARPKNHVEAFEERMLLAGSGSDKALEDFSAAFNNLASTNNNVIDTNHFQSAHDILLDIFKADATNTATLKLITADPNVQVSLEEFYQYCSTDKISDKLGISIQAIQEGTLIDKLVSNNQKVQNNPHDSAVKTQVRSEEFINSISVVKNNLTNLLSTITGESIDNKQPIDASKFDHIFSDKFKVRLAGKATLTAVPDALLKELNKSDSKLHSIIEEVNAMEVIFESLKNSDSKNSTHYLSLLQASLDKGATSLIYKDNQNKSALLSKSGSNANSYFTVLNEWTLGTEGAKNPLAEKSFAGQLFQNLASDAVEKVPDSLNKVLVEADEKLSEYVWKGEVNKIKYLGNDTHSDQIKKFFGECSSLVQVMQNVQANLIKDSLISGDFEHAKKEMQLMKEASQNILKAINQSSANIKTSKDSLTLDQEFKPLENNFKTQYEDLRNTFDQFTALEKEWSDYKTFGNIKKLQNWIPSVFGGMKLAGLSNTMKWAWSKAVDSWIHLPIDKASATASEGIQWFDSFTYTELTDLKNDFKGDSTIKTTSGFADPNIGMFVEQVELVEDLNALPQALTLTLSNADASTIVKDLSQFFTVLKTLVKAATDKGLLGANGSLDKGIHWFGELKNLKIDKALPSMANLVDYIEDGQGARDDAALEKYLKELPVQLNQSLNDFINNKLLSENFLTMPLADMKTLLNDLKTEFKNLKSVSAGNIQSEYIKSISGGLASAETSLDNHIKQLNYIIQLAKPSQLQTIFSDNNIQSIATTIAKDLTLPKGLQFLPNLHNALTAFKSINDASGHKFPAIEKLKNAIQVDAVGNKQTVYNAIWDFALLSELNEFRDSVKPALEKLQKALPDDLEIAGETVNLKELLGAQIDRLSYKQELIKQTSAVNDFKTTWSTTTNQQDLQSVFAKLVTEYSAYKTSIDLTALASVNNLTGSTELATLNQFKQSLQALQQELNKLDITVQDEGKFTAKDRKEFQAVKKTIDDQVSSLTEEANKALKKASLPEVKTLDEFLDDAAWKNKRTTEIQHDDLLKATNNELTTIATAVATEIAKVDGAYNTALSYYQTATDLAAANQTAPEIQTLKAIETALKGELTKIETVKADAVAKNLLTSEEIATIDAAMKKIHDEGYSRTKQKVIQMGLAATGAVVVSGVTVAVGIPALGNIATLVGSVLVPAVGGAGGIVVAKYFVNPALKTAGALAEVQYKIQAIEYAQATAQARIDSNVGVVGAIQKGELGVAWGKFTDWVGSIGSSGFSTSTNILNTNTTTQPASTTLSASGTISGTPSPSTSPSSSSSSTTGSTSSTTTPSPSGSTSVSPTPSPIPSSSPSGSTTP